jgi:hypothetical protein
MHSRWGWYDLQCFFSFIPAFNVNVSIIISIITCKKKSWKAGQSWKIPWCSHECSGGKDTVYLIAMLYEFLYTIITHTGKPWYMRFWSMWVSVNTVTNIYTIPLYVPLKISNSVAYYWGGGGGPKAVVYKQCSQIVLLPRPYAAINSVLLRRPSNRDVSQQCPHITVFHHAQQKKRYNNEI